jgi:hypothetical protein
VLLLFYTAIEAQDNVYLFPDRTSCVSGDKVWFSAYVANEESDNSGTVIHVQLDNLNNNHITTVSVICKKNSAEGYLYIPDSLSTGIYAIKAFTNTERNHPQAVICQKLLAVYNRFDNEITEINFPENKNQPVEQMNDRAISVSVNGKKMHVGVNFPDDLKEQAEEIIVTAGLADPLSESFNQGWINGAVEDNGTLYSSEKEENGLIISGQVLLKKNNEPKAGAIVLLSVSDSIPYLDYCVSDAQGVFTFYLRNVVGKGKLALQELSDSAELTEIKLFDNFINTPKLSTSLKIFSANEKSFSENLVKASYFNRFFDKSEIDSDTFSITSDFKYTFYGEPTKTYYPNLFIDLPDFREIAREVLVEGVRYRKKEGKAIVRMVDYQTNSIFKNEPFMLLDGIPVFDASLFDKMGTKDINRVDAVFYKQYFGDLSFDGVLSVFSNNPTLAWAESVPSINLINYNCIQPSLKWSFQNKLSNGISPDFKKVFFRDKWNNIDSIENIDFDCSDIDGDVVINIILITKKHKVYQLVKTVNSDSKK